MRAVGLGFGKYRPPKVWPPTPGYWKDALVRLVHENGSRVGTGAENGNVTETDAVWYSADPHFLVLYDRYPKARVHLLAVAVPDINDLEALRPEHLPLLLHLDHFGATIANQCVSLTLNC